MAELVRLEKLAVEAKSRMLNDKMLVYIEQVDCQRCKGNKAAEEECEFLAQHSKAGCGESHSPLADDQATTTSDT
ncbi:hypothetical protein Tco_1146321 [Tanacetum coccineum]